MSNANPLQLLRSNTANKRPDPTALADGRPAINTNAVSPGLFFKDSAGNLVKVGPVHVGTTAPNASPASGGATGNSLGEQWLDTTGGVYALKIWDGSTWRSETGTFVDASGDTMTGALVMDNQQQVRFREVTANGTNYIALQAPASVASDKTITLPDVNGTVVTTGDTGTVTSTMIADATIVDADISASAEIAVSKLADGSARQLLQTDAAGTGVEWTSNVDVPGTLDVTGAATFDGTVAVTGALTKSGSNVVTVGDTGTVTSTMILDGTIVNADVNASAAIAGTKISPDFGSQNVTTTGTNTAASFIPTSSTVPANGVYLPAANSVAISTGGSGRLFVDASGNVGVGTATPAHRLSIEGTTYANSSLSLSRFTTTASSSQELIFRKSNSDTQGTNTAVGTGTKLGGILFTGATGSAYQPGFGILSVTTSDWGTGTYSSALTFVDNVTSSERLRITSTGLVGVGTSSPQAPLHVLGAVRFGLASPSTGGAGSIYNEGNNIALEAFSANDVNTKRNILLAPYGGSVGVGTTGPSSYSSAADDLVVAGSGNTGITIAAGSSSYSSVYFADGTTGSDPYRGIVGYNHTSDELVFYTAGLLRSTIDSSGRLLVGTSSALTTISDQPRVQVFVGDQGAASYIRGSANEFGPNIHLAKTRSTTPGVYSVLQSGDELGSIFFIGDDGSDLNQTGARISAAVDGTPGANDMPGRLVFSTTADGASSPTERLRISSDGTVRSSNVNGTNLLCINDGATNTALIYFQTSTTELGKIRVNGAGVAYDTTSDYRLKENIEPITDAVARLQELKPWRFNFISHPNVTVDGFLAHEAQEVVPEAVGGYKDEVDADGNPIYQGIDQSKLVPLLTAALQEAIGEIESLKVRVVALETP